MGRAVAVTAAAVEVAAVEVAAVEVAAVVTHSNRRLVPASRQGHRSQKGGSREGEPQRPHPAPAVGWSFRLPHLRLRCSGVA